MPNISISNIAWDSVNDVEVFNLLHEYGITGIEIAPTKIFKDLLAVTDTEVLQYKNYLNSNGFSIPAMQSIFFGKPEFQIFDPSTHDEMFRYIDNLGRIAKLLDCRVLVFGCPKNRSYNEASNIESAIEVFREMADILLKYNVTIGLEANPSVYNCNYATSINDVIDIVDKVNKPNFKVHFDTGASDINKEDILSQILQNWDKFCHLHISAPFLENIKTLSISPTSVLSTINSTNYNNWISIEMKSQPEQLYNILSALESLLHG